MKMDALREAFSSLCAQFGARCGALSVEMGEERGALSCALVFRCAKFELVYCWKWSDVAPPSVLFCRAYPVKNVPICLHIPELLACAEVEEYRACCFPCIESPDRMRACFGALAEIVEGLIPLADSKGREILARWLEDSFPGEQIDPWNADAQRWLRRALRAREPAIVSRYTTHPAYVAYLRGDWSRAAALYGREGEKLSPYERGLLRFMERRPAEGFEPISGACFSLMDCRRANGAGRRLRRAAAFCLPVVLLSGLLQWLCTALGSRGALYAFCAPWWSGLVWGALPALAGYGALQRRIVSASGGNVDFWDAANPRPWEGRLRMALFALASAACLAWCVLLPSVSVRFYEDHACYSEHPTLRPREFRYGDVVEIAHVTGRYSDDGDRIARASYVLTLRDGTRLDLDGYASEAEFLEAILHIFPGREIRERDAAE